MLTRKINDNVYMFRQVDWELKEFHGSIYPLDNGTTYNCYLIIDEQVTLVDTIESEYSDILIKHLRNVLGTRIIDNIVVNHVEPDHSGGFLRIYEEFGVKNVYTSNAGKKAMQSQFFKDVEYNSVKTGDEINTGKFNLMFYLTPFVHWPDNMVTFLKEEKILFSNDAFGQHITSTNTFAKECGIEMVLDSAKEYYANIVLPYNSRVVKVLNDLASLEIKMILPAHGVGYKDCIPNIIEAYTKWSSGEAKKKVIIVYDSIWGNSKNISLTIGETLVDFGFEVKRYQLSKMRPSTILKELLDAEYLLIGSGNHNGSMMPSVAEFIERIDGCNLKDKKGLTFGSYGWSKNYSKKLESRVSEAGIELLGEGVYINYVPTPEDSNSIQEKIISIFENEI